MTAAARSGEDRARLVETVWRERERAHIARATEFTRAHLERKARGEKHPIWDFLFTYYPFKPAQIKTWHPGAGVTLENGAASRSGWKYYSASDPQTNSDAWVNVTAFMEKRGRTVDYIENLLRQTLERTPRFGCFGLHEWAMVYKLTPEQLRHRGLRLRIGHLATDRVVEDSYIVCSHFDAFRFFTPAAAPLNTLNPTRETQPETEQPGCLHAGMDVYKWAAKLEPLVPGELLLDCFELARDIRLVDMQASPYDISEYGYAAVPIETPAGRAQYAELQRGFALRGNQLRQRVLDAIALARAHAA
ncbi:3-methyladenine DNA glycosylase [Canibacter zhoujuaniae]|uniref:3-methyladenine DNA glycosylase n=1 Tax=Canibacter zhoujuaniae TaxID=2708343 RepID=UPI00142002FD|nr:3-methyladenine DNA glycosylase [Canibacter zhoujuaniae]